MINCLHKQTSFSKHIFLFDIQMEVSGVEAFLLLLDHFEFFPELRVLFTYQSSSSKNYHSVSTDTAASVNRIDASTSMSAMSGSSSQSKHREEPSFERYIIVISFLFRFSPKQYTISCVLISKKNVTYIKLFPVDDLNVSTRRSP